MAEHWPLLPLGQRHEEARLSALLDDELDDDDALEVVRHVSSCARCFEELEAIREARAALRGLPAVPMPPRVRLADITPAAHQPSIARWVLSAFVASAAVLGAAAFVAGGQQGTVNPPVDVYVVDHVGGVDAGPLLHPVHLGR
ncbi:MAG: zf-HC2 domain-containing protein [Nitriliruptorales bacterium]